VDVFPAAGHTQAGEAPEDALHHSQAMRKFFEIDLRR
jgi:hypothetical protein